MTGITSVVNDIQQPAFYQLVTFFTQKQDCCVNTRYNNGS